MEIGENYSAGVEHVPGLQHHIFDVCDGTMSVYEAGQKDRPVVVMLHGAMFDQVRFSWDQLFPFLSRYYHLFAPDIPRHGDPGPGQEISVMPGWWKFCKKHFAGWNWTHLTWLASQWAVPSALNMPRCTPAR
ncbi:MAG: hypothetical protein RQM92_04280 [Candidatus Syntrophopropionicum ammoniitolerans]